jgi:hypothetical protein
MKRIALLIAMGMLISLPAMARDQDSNNNSNNADRLAFDLVKIFSFSGSLVNPPEVIGIFPESLRANFYFAPGGIITGSKLNGKVNAVGGDWLTLRTDGVGLVDVRTTFQSNDGAVIAIDYTGRGEFGPNGLQDFLNGTLPRYIPLQSTINFRTADPRYAWLNRIKGIAVGEVDLATLSVRYNVYQIVLQNAGH